MENLLTSDGAKEANLNLNILHTYVGNPTKEKFLFYFQPRDVARESLCGCSLRIGVQVIAILFIATTLSSLFSALRLNSLIDLILTGIAFTLYLIAGICVMYAANVFSFTVANIANTIYSLLFILNLINYLIVSLLILLGVYTPLGTEDHFKAGLIFLIASALIMAVQAYMIWMVFSFMVHLRNNRIGLITGDLYKAYEEYPITGSVPMVKPIYNTGTARTVNPRTNPYDVQG
jgi:hypothetical protein